MRLLKFLWWENVSCGLLSVWKENNNMVIMTSNFKIITDVTFKLYTLCKGGEQLFFTQDVSVGARVCQRNSLRKKTKFNPSSYTSFAFTANICTSLIHQNTYEMYHHAIIATINMYIHPKPKEVLIRSQKAINQIFMAPNRLSHVNVQQTLIKTANTCTQKCETVT
jgi:hypothetical protein